MTNAEKYLKDNVNIHEIACEMVKFLDNETNASNIFIDDIETYFMRKTKPTLTEDERVILRNIDKTQLELIGRTATDGELYLAYRYGTNKYEVMHETEFDMAYGHLFKFIKERRRILNRRTFERRIKQWQLKNW